MELLQTLGIDWRLLIAQIVNFLVLMGVLYFVLYKPLVQMLEKRRVRVVESMDNAEKIRAELERTKKESEALLNAARTEAQRIITAAQENADLLRTSILDKTKNEVSLIVAQSREHIATERAELMQNVRAEAADLIALATERVIGQKITPAKDRNLIEEIIETV